MDRKLTIKIGIISFILLYILVLLDGAVSFLSHSFTLIPSNQISWYGALSGLTLLTFELKFNFTWVALFLGVTADIFYSGIVGFYAISYVLAAIFLKWLFANLPNNFLYVIASYFLTLTLVSSVYYLLNSYLGLTDVSPLQYVADYLPVTLFTNLIYFVTLYIPVIKFIEYIKKKLELKNAR